MKKNIVQGNGRLRLKSSQKWSYENLAVKLRYFIPNSIAIHGSEKESSLMVSSNVICLWKWWLKREEVVNYISINLGERKKERTKVASFSFHN